MARALLAGIVRELKRGPLTLSAGAERRLQAASWPGNVRELANALERAAILADGDTIREDHLWVESQPARAAASAEIKPLSEMERDAIERALESVGGNRRRAAELLGIGERTLYDKLKRFGLE
jgi:DNA-binding NtrC family response regulator